MNLNLGCIVEGRGEEQAVPTLVRRFPHFLECDIYANVLRPIRVGRYKLVKPGELERAVELSAQQLVTP